MTAKFSAGVSLKKFIEDADIPTNGGPNQADRVELINIDGVYSSDETDAAIAAGVSGATIDLDQLNPAGASAGDVVTLVGGAWTYQTPAGGGPSAASAAEVAAGSVSGKYVGPNTLNGYQNVWTVGTGMNYATVKAGSDAHPNGTFVVFGAVSDANNTITQTCRVIVSPGAVWTLTSVIFNGIIFIECFGNIAYNKTDYASVGSSGNVYFTNFGRVGGVVPLVLLSIASGGKVLLENVNTPSYSFVYGSIVNATVTLINCYGGTTVSDISANGKVVILGGRIEGAYILQAANATLEIMNAEMTNTTGLAKVTVAGAGALLKLVNVTNHAPVGGVGANCLTFLALPSASSRFDNLTLIAGGGGAYAVDSVAYNPAPFYNCVLSNQNGLTVNASVHVLA